MSFEIQCTSRQSPLLLHPVTQAEAAAKSDFVDKHGRFYSGHFNGRDVIFCDGESEYIGRWLQGTSATSICQSRCLSGRFSFTFMDHGCTPQRLHAWWQFDGRMDDAIEQWKNAGFFISNVDRRINRNYPKSSIHMRTRGVSITGADSSHVIIPPTQIQLGTHGEIHVGEFNPFTGWGVGFLLHQMERSAFFNRYMNLQRCFLSIQEIRNHRKVDNIV